MFCLRRSHDQQMTRQSKNYSPHLPLSLSLYPLPCPVVQLSCTIRFHSIFPPFPSRASTSHSYSFSFSSTSLQIQIGWHFITGDDLKTSQVTVLLLLSGQSEFNPTMVTSGTLRNLLTRKLDRNQTSCTLNAATVLLAIMYLLTTTRVDERR